MSNKPLNGVKVSPRRLPAKKRPPPRPLRVSIGDMLKTKQQQR